MKERVAITGQKGVIGTVLTEGLKEEYEITPINSPENDARDYDSLTRIFPGHKAVIHLAWTTDIDNFKSDVIDPDNTRMFFNVYRAALETGVKRVVMASSVHANRFYGWEDPGYMSPDTVSVGDSPYGAHKVAMEAMGRYFATKGLEVVCVRFGGVSPDNIPAKSPWEETAVYFSHRDCQELVRKIISAKEVPNNFVIVYGVSNNRRKIHDTTNSFGWTPQDSDE